MIEQRDVTKLEHKSASFETTIVGEGFSLRIRTDDERMASQYGKFCSELYGDDPEQASGYFQDNVRVKITDRDDNSPGGGVSLSETSKKRNLSINPHRLAKKYGEFLNNRSDNDFDPRNYFGRIDYSRQDPKLLPQFMATAINAATVHEYVHVRQFEKANTEEFTDRLLSQGSAFLNYVRTALPMETGMVFVDALVDLPKFDDKMIYVFFAHALATLTPTQIAIMMRRSRIENEAYKVMREYLLDDKGVKPFTHEVYEENPRNIN